jgi:hypothetical protein
LLKDTGVAELQVGDDDPRSRFFLADFDGCEDPLDAAPALQLAAPSKNSLKWRELAALGRSFEARLGAGLETLRYAGDVVVGATPRM